MTAYGEGTGMRRYFNTEGICKPDIHYMVRLDSRLEQMKRLYVDRGKYFTINRGRQYGKTTTLAALAEYLKDDYAVLSMDFQALSSECFADEPTFVMSLIEYLEEIVFGSERLGDIADGEPFQDLLSLKKQERVRLDQLFRCLGEICGSAGKPVVLMIDETDSASDNQVFIDFLAQLRRCYLDRESKQTFHSVILAGVYDIKNLKLKIRPDQEHQYNSPWNIAAKFRLDMDFSAEQIEQMLRDYEDDWNTGMDVAAVAQCVYGYTSGYPYLVSAICKLLDEEIPGRKGFEDSAGNR